MRILKLSFKYARNSISRQIPLAIFIFITSFLMLVFSCFTETLSEDIETALIHEVGNIQIRSSETESKDMFNMDGGSEEIPTMDNELTSKVLDMVKETGDYYEVAERYRINVQIDSNESSEYSLITGINPDAKAYKLHMKIVEGRYMKEGNDHEILLNKAQAESLNVTIGDIVKLSCVREDGSVASEDVKVVGIGVQEKFSEFGYFVSYMDLDTAQKLQGVSEGTLTDVILFHKGANRDSVDMAKDLTKQFKELGLADQLLFSNWTDMGGFFMAIVILIQVQCTAYKIILLFVAAILIINIIVAMSIERRVETATLKAIGYSTRQIVGLFMSEILTISGATSILGIVVGSGFLTFISKYELKPFAPYNFILGDTFILRFYPYQTVPVFLVIIIVAFVTALIPTVKAASEKPIKNLF